MLIKITNKKAIGLLHELEELNLIEVLKENFASEKPKLCEKYKGVFTKDDAKSFNAHTQNMRGEWENT